MNAFPNVRTPKVFNTFPSLSLAMERVVARSVDRERPVLLLPRPINPLRMLIRPLLTQTFLFGLVVNI